MQVPRTRVSSTGHSPLQAWSPSDLRIVVFTYPLRLRPVPLRDYALSRSGQLLAPLRPTPQPLTGLHPIPLLDKALSHSQSALSHPQSALSHSQTAPHPVTGQRPMQLPHSASPAPSHRLTLCSASCSCWGFFRVRFSSGDNWFINQGRPAFRTGIPLPVGSDKEFL